MGTGVKDGAQFHFITHLIYFELELKPLNLQLFCSFKNQVSQPLIQN